MDGTTALAVLGLEPGATEHDIKRAFRSRAKSAHPDASGDASTFVVLQAAYERALGSIDRAPQSVPAASGPIRRWFDATPPRGRIDLVDSAPTRRPAASSAVAPDEQAFADLLRRELAHTAQT